MMEFSIVIPAYKEAENLEVLIPRMKDTLDETREAYEILIVDTMEPVDHTEAVCKANGVHWIQREGGNLYGDAIRTGISKAEGKYIVVMDADGSHNPADIARLYQEMQTGKYDLIIGSRYCKGGYTDNSFVLKMMSWMLNVTYRIIFGLKVKDVSDSFRMYKADQLKELDLLCDNFDIVEEILIVLNYTKNSFAIKEVPISFNKRMAGESKRDLVKFVFSYMKTIKRLVEVKKRCIRK